MTEIQKYEGNIGFKIEAKDLKAAVAELSIALEQLPLTITRADIQRELWSPMAHLDVKDAEANPSPFTDGG